jgi:signal transduction histidine kinase
MSFWPPPSSCIPEHRFPSSGQGSQGLGLGLYITRMTVEAMQGRIWVTSKPGAGSTFSFTLPMRAGQEKVA